MSSNGRVSNCGFRTTGGAGGGYAAVNLSTGSYGSFDHNVIVDSDQSGIYVAMNMANVSHNFLNDTDTEGIFVAATGDASTIIGNRAQATGSTNFITVVAGGNYVTVTANTGDKVISNAGTGGAVAGNTQF